MWFSCCSGDKVWGHLINLKSWTQTCACKWRIIEHSSTAAWQSRLWGHLSAGGGVQVGTLSRDLWPLRGEKEENSTSWISSVSIHHTSHLLVHSSPRGWDTWAENSCALTGLPSVGKPVTFWLNGLLNIVECGARTMCSTTFWTWSPVEYKLAAFSVSILHYWERFGLLCW